MDAIVSLVQGLHAILALRTVDERERDGPPVFPETTRTDDGDDDLDLGGLEAWGLSSRDQSLHMMQMTQMAAQDSQLATATRASHQVLKISEKSVTVGGMEGWMDITPTYPSILCTCPYGFCREVCRVFGMSCLLDGSYLCSGRGRNA